MIALMSHREQRVLIVAAFAVACVLLDRAVTLRMNFAKALDQKIVLSREELRRGRALLGSRDAITQAEAELGMRPGGATEKSDVPKFLSELDQAARSAGVVVISLRPGSGEDGTSAVMSLTSDWQGLVRFFSSVQSKPHFLEILRFRVEHKTPQDRLLRVECVLKSSFLDPGD